MLHDLGWHDPKDRWQDLRLALLYKTITGHVAIKSNQNDLVAAYNRTRANHIYKFRKIGASSAQFIPADSSTRSNYNFKFWGIGSNSTPYRYSFFPRTIPTWNLLSAMTVEAMSVDVFKCRLP